MPTHRDSLRRLSVSELVELTGMAPKTVTTRLRAAGLEPAAKDGRTTRYDPREALPMLYEAGDPQRERARLDAARAALAEQELQKRSGELVPAVDVEYSLITLSTAVSGRLQGIPSQLGPELAGEATAADCERLVRDAIHTALHDLADAGDAAQRRLKAKRQ